MKLCFLTYEKPLFILSIMKYRIKIIGSIFVLIFVLCASLNVFGQNRVSEKEFFSYERFVFAMELLEAVKVQQKTIKDINMFTVYFNDGIYALSNKKYPLALKKLYRARAIWPEYFGPSFLIALTYERDGNIDRAAQFYKEYLNKLKILEAGHFPISAPLIKVLNKDNIDTFAFSRAIIKEHLQAYDIDIDKVKPPFFVSEFVKSFFRSFILLLMFLIGYFLVFPYVKKEYRIKHPKEGFWICRNCQNENPELMSKCHNCGKLHQS